MDLSALITRGFAVSDRILWLLVVEQGACSTSRLSPDDWYPASAQAEDARHEAADALSVCAESGARGVPGAVATQLGGRAARCLGRHRPCRTGAAAKRAGRAAHPRAGQEPGRGPDSKPGRRPGSIVIEPGRLSAYWDTSPINTIGRGGNLHPSHSAGLMLEADDGLAAEAAVTKLFEHLPRAVQFNRGADARSDRAVREHARNLVQPLRR